MPNFINGSVGINDDMVAAGQRYGLQHTRAQQRWQDQEMRRLVDSDNRRNYALSQATSGTLAGSRGVFDDNADLAGLNPSDAPVARATGAGPMSLQAPGAGVGGAVDSHVGLADVAPTPTEAPIVDTRNDRSPERPIRLQRAESDFRNASQRSSYERYRNAWDEVMGGRVRSIEPLARALDQMVRTRVLTQPEANAELARVGGYLGDTVRHTRNPRRHIDANSIREVNVGEMYGVPRATATVPPVVAPVGDVGVRPDPQQYNDPNSADFVPNTEDNGGRGLVPPDAPDAPDAYEQPFSDASGDIRPTRDMRLIQTARDNALRQAEISAQHGDNAGAQVLFAQALQGEAALFQRTNEILYRNASSGNLAAMSRLLERFHGLPRGTARVQQTDERRPRFFLQRNTARPGERPNWVSITGSTPQTRDQMLGGFLNLVDAAGAAARRETDSEMIRARIGQETDIAVAGIGYQGTRLRVLADAAIAQMDDATRRIAAQGQGRFAPDPEGNGVFYTHPGPDGEPITDFYRVEEQASPDTEGDRTIDVPTSTRVTGMPGVGTN